MQNTGRYLKELQTIEFRMDNTALSLSHYMPVSNYFETLESFRFDAQFEVEYAKNFNFDFFLNAHNSLKIILEGLQSKDPGDDFFLEFKKLILLNFDPFAFYNKHTLPLLTSIFKAKKESLENMIQACNIEIVEAKTVSELPLIKNEKLLNNIIEDLTYYFEDEDLKGLGELLLGRDLYRKLTFQGDAVKLVSYFRELVKTGIVKRKKSEVTSLLTSHFNYQVSGEASVFKKSYVQKIMYEKDGFAPSCSIKSSIF